MHSSWEIISKREMIDEVTSIESFQFFPSEAVLMIYPQMSVTGLLGMT